MTCIVAYKENGKVYMGGDSAGSSGNYIATRKDEKVFINGGVIFGFTSSFRMGQILKYKFSVPKQKDESDMKYLTTVFVDSIIKCFKDNNYGNEENTVKRGGFFLIGYNGSIYEIQSDFQVSETADDFSSVGSGELYALGALNAIKKTTKKPEEKITIALETAEYFSPTVRGPFNILSL